MNTRGRHVEMALVGPGWAAAGGTHARGYAHLEDRFLPARQLAEFLDSRPSEAAWHGALRGLNGCFAAVTRREGSVVAAVDRVRSIPLFYLAEGPDVFLSDCAYPVLDAATNRQVNAIAETEFCLTGYVTAGETLYTAVRQIEAGEQLCWNTAETGAPVRRRYYEFRHGDFFPGETGELIDRLVSVHENIFRRLVRSAQGRTLVVPMSGGHDTRLIGLSLRDLGVRNVVCYSYGAPGNWEARISQELARYLGFRWEFVPYSAEKWKEWSASESFRKYFRLAGNLTSVPHVQDWPAVYELQRGGRLPSDSIIVPGHSGDFFAGNHIPRHFTRRSAISRRELLDSIHHVHYSLWDWPKDQKNELRSRFDDRIESITGRVHDCTPGEAADHFERWDFQERQAKFICNAVRVYESFGYEWRLPLMDHELIDYWSRIPVRLRTGRKLYLEFVNSRQRLPITPANTDHGHAVALLIQGIEASRLTAVAKRIQRAARRLRAERGHESSPLAWHAIIDRSFFQRTYTGKELLHSYLAIAYCDAVLHCSRANPPRSADASSILVCLSN